MLLDRWSLRWRNRFDRIEDPFLLLVLRSHGLKGLLVVDRVLLSVLVGIPHLSTCDELLQCLDFASVADEAVA